MPDLPHEWYEEPRPGVRRMHPPGVSFRWMDVVIGEAGDDALGEVVRELGLDAEIESSVRESRGESVRMRQAGVTVLRLELPAAVLVDAEEDYVLSMVLAENRLLTVRRHRLGVIESACQGISETGGTVVTLLGAAAEIGDEFLDRLGPSLRRTAEDLDLAELGTDESRGARIERLAAIRRVLLAIDRHLDPLQNVIQRWLVDESSRAATSDRDSLRGLLDRANWMEHRIHGQLDRARILADRDHILTMDELSTTMYRLTWIATIFLPLTFVTGLLGINVGGIPFAESGLGFWIVCGILLAVAAGTAIALGLIVRSNRRSGRPGLDDLTRREQQP